MDGNIFLETERLVLRRFREEDFDDFFEYAADEEMCRQMGRDLITDRESARPTFDWLKDREERGCVLVYKENGRVVGNLTVTKPADYLDGVRELEGKRGCSLSFSVSRHYQRRGLMYEALTAVIDELFSAEGLDYIHCGNFSFNTASRELQKKLGFTFLMSVRFPADEGEIETEENILWRK